MVECTGGVDLDEVVGCGLESTIESRQNYYTHNLVIEHG